MNLTIKQYSEIPFEVFTIDDLYSEDELNMFTQYVIDADV
jgi:hypothetical protein